MWTTTVGRGLARSLPSHLQGRRGVGRYVSQVCGTGQGGQHSPAEHQSQGQDLEEGERSKGEEACERPIVSREAVRQALWEKHLQNPVTALDEAFERTAVVGDPTDSSAAGKNQELSVRVC